MDRIAYIKKQIKDMKALQASLHRNQDTAYAAIQARIDQLEAQLIGVGGKL